MNPLRCSHLDLLLRRLVDCYSRFDNRDTASVLTDSEIAADVHAMHVAMAEHQMSCPVCIRIDRTSESVFNAPMQKVQPIR